MASTITESLERSFQNCSLNHQKQSIEREGSSTTSDNDSPENHSSDDDATLELNSDMSLPYHWEQCLDLKTGEIYYINWRNGKKAKEDPRSCSGAGDYSYDSSSDESSYESSSESSRDSHFRRRRHHLRTLNENVLVVGGCKRCLMYFMVPKLVGDCPKCSGQLLHFDQSQNGSH